MFEIAEQQVRALSEELPRAEKALAIWKEHCAIRMQYQIHARNDYDAVLKTGNELEQMLQTLSPRALSLYTMMRDTEL